MRQPLFAALVATLSLLLPVTGTAAAPASVEVVASDAVARTGSVSGAEIGARAGCRLGRAADERTYEVCEDAHQVTLARAFGADAPFDPFVARLVAAQDPAPRAPRPYARFSTRTGLGGGGEDFRSGLSLGLGTGIAPNLRLEATLDLPGMRLDRAPAGLRAVALPLMATLALDLPSFGRVTPWLGAGIGVAALDLDPLADVPPAAVVPTHRSETVAMLSLGAGASYALADTLALDLSWRYARTLSGEAGADGLDRHDVLVGVQVSLP
ncbi:outer membrane protein [Salinarimonas ramus]|nr:outer membrane beta-barrel protein [Salinarimonas ramus]